MQRRAAEESLTDHGKDNSNGRAHVGDAIRHKPGILGFLRQIGFMGATVHKTANVLNQMPKSLQAKAKGHLHDIWMAETRADAEAAFDFFIAAYGAKYHKAAERLVKDRERLLSFYDFPAEHWKHTRTTNPIESTFATVRLRTVKTKGCLSRKTALAMAFKLILSARRKWRKLDGSNQLAELVEGVPFKDGIKITKHAA